MGRREVMPHAEEVKDTVGWGALEPDGWGGGLDVL